jgi:hypothetical protein
VAITCIAGILHVNAWAVLIAVPPASFTNNNGNSAFVPFDGGPARFQQVYEASAFSSLAPSGGGLIREIVFRDDALEGHSFDNVTIANLEIGISTTLQAADGLSRVFDENVGPNQLVALGPGPVRISGYGGGGFSYFNIGFALSQPFFYDPADGNLLLDFRIYQGIQIIRPIPSAIAILDAYAVTGDQISSVYASGLTLPTNGQTSTLGLATRFLVTPLPQLTVALRSTNLVFRWLSQPGGFTLQQSAVLGPDADWQLTGGIVTTNGAYREVPLPLDLNAVARFFRLVLPPSSSGSAGVQTATPLGTASKQEP